LATRDRDSQKRRILFNCLTDTIMKIQTHTLLYSNHKSSQPMISIILTFTLAIWTHNIGISCIVSVCTRSTSSPVVRHTALTVSQGFGCIKRTISIRANFNYSTRACFDLARVTYIPQGSVILILRAS